MEYRLSGSMGAMEVHHSAIGTCGLNEVPAMVYSANVERVWQELR